MSEKTPATPTAFTHDTLGTRLDVGDVVEYASRNVVRDRVKGITPMGDGAVFVELTFGADQIVSGEGQGLSCYIRAQDQSWTAPEEAPTPDPTPDPEPVAPSADEVSRYAEACGLSQSAAHLFLIAIRLRWLDLCLMSWGGGLSVPSGRDPADGVIKPLPSAPALLAAAHFIPPTSYEAIAHAMATGVTQEDSRLFLTAERLGWGEPVYLTEGGDGLRLPAGIDPADGVLKRIPHLAVLLGRSYALPEGYAPRGHELFGMARAMLRTEAEVTPWTRASWVKVTVKVEGYMTHALRSTELEGYVMTWGDWERLINLLHLERQAVPDLDISLSVRGECQRLDLDFTRRIF